MSSGSDSRVISVVSNSSIESGVINRGSIVSDGPESERRYAAIRVDTTSRVSGGITNYGNISSANATGIYNQGNIDSIINYGTITGLSAGVENESGSGKIQNLSNLQGAGNSAGALTYKGDLPTTYNILINSTTQYGKLNATAVSGTMAFRIGSGSTVQTATYSDVLSGISLANLSETAGTYGSYSWNLALQSGQTSIWDLVVSSTSTNITNPLVDVTATTNTTTNTNTAANLSGTVTVNVANGAAAYLAQRRMTIVSSTGLSGMFIGVTTSQNLSFLTPTLSYDANNVYLAYSLTPFSAVAKNINQRNVGNALTIAALGPVNALGVPILNALFYGHYQNAQAVMDTVSGSGLAGVQSSAMQVGQMASSSVSDQIAFWRSGETQDATGVTSREGNNPRSFMAYAPVERNISGKGPIRIKGPSEMAVSVAPRTYRAWGSMFGGAANYLSDAGRGSAASNVGFYGGLIGVDYQVQPNLLLGVALGGSSSNFNVGSLSTNGALTGFHAGLYGAYTMGASYLALNETFSGYNNQTTRKAGGYALMPYEQLSAQFGSTEFRTRLEGGHSLLMGGLKATPFVAAEIAAYQSNYFAEKSTIVASTFALKNNGQSINSLPTFIGLRLSNAYTLDNGWRVAPIGSVAYVHEFFPQRQFTNILMSMPGTDFNVSGPRSTYNLVQTKLGAQLNLTNKFALFTDFQGEFSPMSQSYSGKAGMKYTW